MVSKYVSEYNCVNSCILLCSSFLLTLCVGMLWERLLFPHKKFAWLTRDLEAIDLNSSDSEAEDALKNINKGIASYM